MKKFWNSSKQHLAPREQRLIVWGGSILLTGFLYAYVWHPITLEQGKLHDTLPKLRADAAQMLLQAQEIEKLIQIPREKTTLGPREAIQQAINQAGMDIGSITITLLNDQRVKIESESVTFNKYLSLLHILHQTHHVRLVSTIIENGTEKSTIKFITILISANN